MKKQLASLEEAFNEVQQLILVKFVTQQPVSTEEMHRYIQTRDAYKAETTYQPPRAA